MRSLGWLSAYHCQLQEERNRGRMKRETGAGHTRINHTQPEWATNASTPLRSLGGVRFTPHLHHYGASSCRTGVFTNHHVECRRYSWLEETDWEQTPLVCQLSHSQPAYMRVRNGPRSHLPEFEFFPIHNLSLLRLIRLRCLRFWCV